MDRLRKNMVKVLTGSDKEMDSYYRGRDLMCVLLALTGLLILASFSHAQKVEYSLTIPSPTGMFGSVYVKPSAAGQNPCTGKLDGTIVNDEDTLALCINEAPTGPIAGWKANKETGELTLDDASINKVGIGSAASEALLTVGGSTLITGAGAVVPSFTDGVYFDSGSILAGGFSSDPAVGVHTFGCGNNPSVLGQNGLVGCGDGNVVGAGSTNSAIIGGLSNSIINSSPNAGVFSSQLSTISMDTTATILASKDSSIELSEHSLIANGNDVKILAANNVVEVGSKNVTHDNTTNRIVLGAVDVDFDEADGMNDAVISGPSALYLGANDYGKNAALAAGAAIEIGIVYGTVSDTGVMLLGGENVTINKTATGVYGLAVGTQFCLEELVATATLKNATIPMSIHAEAASIALGGGLSYQGVVVKIYDLATVPLATTPKDHAFSFHIMGKKVPCAGSIDPGGKGGGIPAK